MKSNENVEKCIETYEQIVENHRIDEVITEAEAEYSATGVLLDAEEILKGLRRKLVLIVTVRYTASKF